MKLVEKRICDRRMLKLLRQWLRAGVLDGGEFLPSDQGVPQGGVISCVLANVMLHELDRVWEDRCSQLGQLIRYADDAVVLCKTEAQAREALSRIGVILSRRRLTLHPTKTQIVYVGDGRQGFDFLGFHCRTPSSPGTDQTDRERSEPSAARLGGLLPGRQFNAQVHGR